MVIMNPTNTNELLDHFSSLLTPGLTVLKEHLKTETGFTPEFWQLIGNINRHELKKERTENLKTQFEIPDTAFDKCKDLAGQLMQEEKWQEAMDLSFLLATLAQDDFEVWLMLGNCRYNLELYEGAILAYLTALIYNPYEMRAYIWQAYTFEKMGLPEKARQTLEIALKFIEDFPNETSDFKEEILNLKKHI